MSRSFITRALKLSSASVSRPIASQRVPCPSSVRMASSNLNSNTISEVTAREKELTGEAQPVKGGPTAQAQKHAKESLSGAAISDITAGEKRVTGEDSPVPGGPTAFAQSQATTVSYFPTQPLLFLISLLRSFAYSFVPPIYRAPLSWTPLRSLP